MNPESDMVPDEYQLAWQAQSSQTRVSIDADLLLKVVQRDQRNFQSGVIGNDVGAAAFALLLLPVWIYVGITQSMPWTMYLTVPVLVWNVVFTLLYRLRCKRTSSQPGEPLLQCVKESLSQVEDQIWLQRNLFWWNFLPLLVSILVFTAHVSLLKAENWLDALRDVNAFLFVFFVAVFYFLYYINQRTVDTRLEPRRQELLTLLASLGDESTGKPAQLTSSMLDIACDPCPVEFGRWSIVAASCFVIAVVIALASGVFDSNYEKAPQSSGPTGDSLGSLVTEQRKEKNLVGLAAMVVVDGQVEAAAADGERKTGSGVPLEVGDRWHLGGITKSITATMIGRLVESGRMDWSDTVGEIFPEADIHEDWKPVTVRQLLTHTAGAPKQFSLEVRRKKPALGPECTQVRLETVLNMMSEKPAFQPGREYAFSNVGYTIAGAMAEKATGVSWEDLVRREVFEPLELTNAGFGPPRSTGITLDQPRGHRKRLAGKVPVAVDDDVDNTPIMSPAGSVHMTLGDLCTYATEHMRGELGGNVDGGKLLSAETYKLLHKPELNHYAYGWIRKEPNAEIPFRIYWHNGSNTMWYAMVVFIPEKNMVVAVTSNDGDIEKAEAAAWEIVKSSVQAIVKKSIVEVEPAQDEEFPKTSPFAAVRWQDSEPEVKLGDEWFKLLSLDELPASEIVAFSQQKYENQWRKRFEEDLVALLTRMGHPPEDKVTLVVQSLASGETSVRKGVSMTEANRHSIKAEADKSGSPER